MFEQMTKDINISAEMIVLSVFKFKRSDVCSLILFLLCHLLFFNMDGSKQVFQLH